MLINKPFWKSDLDPYTESARETSSSSSSSSVSGSGKSGSSSLDSSGVVQHSRLLDWAQSVDASGRERRIAQLQSDVAAGAYSVDPRGVAHAIVNEILGPDISASNLDDSES